MAFPQSFMDELTARNPIEDVVSEYVALTRKGPNRFGLCPFHNEKTASFSVAPEKGIYYCFGCHKGGGVVNFVMEVENLDFPDAVRFLAKRSGLEIPEDDTNRSNLKKQERLIALCKDAARFFHEQLYTKSAVDAQNYVIKRGLSKNTVTRFGIGYAPSGYNSLMDAMIAKGYQKQEILDAGLAVKNDKGNIYDKFRNRLMFPIIDVRGNVIGFGGRVLDDGKPKYLNSPETSIFNKRRNLFAMNIAKKTRQGRLILCEGYMDAITMHQYGFDCAVASLGTALTEEQVNLISKYTNQVVLTYDADEAGQNATRRAIPMLEKAGIQVKILKVREAKDPDEFLKKFGADRFRLLLDGSQNQAEYRLTSLQSKYDLKNDEQRVEFLKKAAQEISLLHSSVEREIYGARAAEAAGITSEAMKLEVEKAYRIRRSKEAKQQEKKALNPVQQVQPGIRSLHYENTRSALAEENVLSMLLLEGSLFELLSELKQEHFSSPLLGRAYEALRVNWMNGDAVSLPSVAERFSAEEMSHLTAVAQKNGTALVSEDVLRDCVAVIREEAGKKEARANSDLMAMRDRMLRKKGI